MGLLTRGVELSLNLLPSSGILFFYCVASSRLEGKCLVLLQLVMPVWEKSLGGLLCAEKRQRVSGSGIEAR